MAINLTSYGNSVHDASSYAKWIGENYYSSSSSSSSSSGSSSGSSGNFGLGKGADTTDTDWYDNIVDTSTMPTYTAPADYEAPDYTAPTYDESKIETGTQRKASAGLRSLRSALQKVSGGSYSNPNVKRMTLRDALAGYGQGIADVLGTASDKATSEYSKKYGYEVDAAKMQYAADTAEAQTNYQSDVTSATTNYSAQLAAWQAKNNALLSNYFKKTYSTDSSSSSSGKSSGSSSGKSYESPYETSYSEDWVPSDEKWIPSNW